MDNEKISNRGKWVKVVPIIVKLLKEKPRHRDEIVEILMKKGLIKKGQRIRVFEDALKCLQNADLVELRNDNRLYWKEYVWYRSELDYKAKLEHSKLLFGIEYLKNEVSIQDILKKNKRKIVKNKFIRQHILTGYPEISDVILSLSKLETELKENKKSLLKQSVRLPEN